MKVFIVEAREDTFVCVCKNEEQAASQVSEYLNQTYSEEYLEGLFEEGWPERHITQIDLEEFGCLEI